MRRSLPTLAALAAELGEYPSSSSCLVDTTPCCLVASSNSS